MTKTTHGWHIPGSPYEDEYGLASVARCGSPKICPDCQREVAIYNHPSNDNSLKNESFDRAVLGLMYPPPPSRPSWDEYGLKLAETVALRADCTRRKVGAILMSPDHSILGAGYNGGPSKGSSCLKGECPRGRLTKEELPSDAPYDTGGGTCVALHAEWNLIIRASYAELQDATIYITEEPCHVCKVIISGTPIKRVVYRSGSYSL